MGKPNPDATNSLMGIIEIFSYISIVFTLVFLFYFVRGEILGRKLERQRIIYALLYLVMGFSLNLLVSFLFEINFAGLYVNAGIFVFSKLCPNTEIKKILMKKIVTYFERCEERSEYFSNEPLILKRYTFVKKATYRILRKK